MRHAILLSTLVLSILLSTTLAVAAAPKRSSKEKMPPSQLVVVEKYNLLPILQILNGELDEYLDLVQISDEDIVKLHDRCIDLITKSRKIGKDKIPGACGHFYRYAVQPQILVNQRVADYMDRLFRFSESRPVTGDDLKDAIGNCALDLRREEVFRDTGNLRGDLCEYTMLFWYNEYFGKKR